MPKFINISGNKYGYLTVIRRIENDINGKAKWLCECKCGNFSKVLGVELRKGRTKSCGCFKNEMLAKVSFKHGFSYDPIYRVWQGMKDRCENPNHKAYRRYVVRGIKICKEWKNDIGKFVNWCIENGWREGLEIDRRNNNGNYVPENCRFVSSMVNSQNQSTTKLNPKKVIFIRNLFKLKKFSVYELSKLFDVTTHTINNTIARRTWKNIK